MQYRQVPQSGDAWDQGALDLLNEVRRIFPWIGKKTEGWNFNTLHEKDNHLGTAILDAVRGGAGDVECHDGCYSRSWRLADGLAAFLTSRSTVNRYKKGGDGAIGPPNKMTIATIIRTNKCTKELAMRLKIQFGLLQTTCPLRGNEVVVGELV